MLVPAYAATIHKSQGSEYPAVVIPVMTQHYAMLQRNLLYTGVTRGKRLVVLVGQKKAVAIAVRNISGRRRWSKLSEWLATPSAKTRACVSQGSKGSRVTRRNNVAKGSRCLSLRLLRSTLLPSFRTSTDRHTRFNRRLDPETLEDRRQNSRGS